MVRPRPAVWRPRVPPTPTPMPARGANRSSIEFIAHAHPDVELGAAVAAIDLVDPLAVVRTRGEADGHRAVARVVAHPDREQRLAGRHRLRQRAHRGGHRHARVGNALRAADLALQLVLRGRQLAQVDRIGRRDARRHVGDARAVGRLAIAHVDLAVVDRTVRVGGVLHAAGRDRAGAGSKLRHVGGVAVGRARCHAGDLAELAADCVADRHRGLRAGGGVDRRRLLRSRVGGHVAGHACCDGGHRAGAQCDTAALLHHRAEADGRALGNVLRLAQRRAAGVRVVAQCHAAAACTGVGTDGL
jgi:hypothetical protein